MAQIRSMAAIYSSAYFTIVAAEGTDAQSDLSWDKYGLNEQTPLLDSGSGHTFSTMTMHKPVGRGSTWASRGWTFQEQLFSRLIVIFHQGRLI